MKKIKGLHMIKTASFVLMMAVVLTFVSIQAMAATCPTPTGVKQTDATEAAFKIAWNASAGATEYGVSVSKDKTTWSDEQIAKTNEFVVAGMASATAYQVRVRAHNASGWSEYSKPYTVVTSPKAPKKIKQTETGSDYVKLTWDAVEGATGYNVYWAKGKAETLLITKKPLEKTEVIIKGIKDNTKYTVDIQPVLKSSTNFVAYGKAATNKKVITLSGPLKNAQVTSWNTTTGEIAVAWSPSSKYATGYEVAFFDKKGKNVKVVNIVGNDIGNCVVKVKKLISAPGTFAVRPYKNLSGAKFYGPYSEAKVIIPEATVTTEQVNANTVKLTWPKIAGARTYRVYYSTQANGGYTQLVKLGKNVTSYTFKNLKPGACYYVYVAPGDLVINKKNKQVTKINTHNTVVVKGYATTN